MSSEHRAKDNDDIRMNAYSEHVDRNSFRIIPQNPAFKPVLLRRFLLLLSILLSLTFLPPPTHAASCLPLPPDAAHWWRAEGNTQDSLGLNHGALEGGTVYDAGRVGQGFRFDGIDDLVEIPTQGFPAGTSDRTLEAWVKIDALVAQEAYFAGYGLFGTMSASYNIGASFGRLYFSSWGPDLFGPQVTLGQWHHVAATNVGSLVTLYLDGVPVNSASLPIDVPPTGTQFFIGKVGGYYGDIRRLQGMVDEATLYTRALTAEEIAAIYQAGSSGKCAPESPANQPVILIPGITGSELFHNGEEIWMNEIQIALNSDFLDVLAMNDLGDSLTNIEVGDIIRKKLTLDIWINLINDLKGVGYVEGQNLFVFPYDWRLDNRINADVLADYITNIIQNTSADKVDLIAHSMGGLVAKDYLRQYGESQVDQVIYLGTPHVGAPKAIKALMFGDDFDTYGIVNPDAIKRIAGNMRSLYQLLPAQDFFNEYTAYVVDMADIDGNGARGALDFSQTQTFIGNVGLNTYIRDRANEFHDNLDVWIPSPELQVRTHNIVSCAQPTIGRIVTLRGYDLDTSTYLQMVDGDKTVPMKSALHTASGVTYYVPNAEHVRMSDDVIIRNLLLDILNTNQVNLQDNRYISIRDGIGNCGYIGTLHSVHSPVDLHAYDSLGNHTGPNLMGGIDEEIPGSSYDVLGDDKFLFLPKGSGATVTLDGTGEGAFRYDIADVTQDGELQSARFFDLPVTPETLGEVIFDENHIDQTIINLDLAGDGAYELTFSPSSILDAEGSADFTSPQITLTSPLPDAVYEHHQIILIQGEITDDTAPLAAHVKVNDNIISDQVSPASPLTVSLSLELPTLPLGTHSLSLSAHDAPGNYAATSTSFTLIATPASVVGLLEWGLTHGWYPDPRVYAIIKKAVEQIPPIPTPPQPLPPKVKQAAITALNTAITLIEKSFQQGRITQEARDMLVGDLGYVREHL